MIQFMDVSKRFKNGTTALSNIDLKINDGEFLYIVGASGAGKSTLTKLLVKEYTPTKGDIIVDGIHLNKMPRNKIAKYRRNIGFVFQNFRLLSDRTAYENIAFAAECIGLSGREVKRRSNAALDFVGLNDRRKHLPAELSAGEQQRIAIARAIVNNPRFIIADEPTGNLDQATAEEIVKLLESVHATGATVIMATHSLMLVESYPHRIIALDHGNVVSDSHKGVYL